MAEHPASPLVLDGWYALHQFFRIDPAPLHPEEPPTGTQAVGTRGEEPEMDGFRARVEAFGRTIAGWEEPNENGWSGLYRIVGGGADFMAMHFRPTLEALGEAEWAVQKSPLAPDLVLTSDYVSVVELGMYALTEILLREAGEAGIEPGSAEWQERVDALLQEESAKRYVQARLRPTQPENMPYVCFYPMDKRRSPEQNWYALPLPERAALMAEHGKTGRRWAGRISQVISGSVGLDDWEWAVTLFAGDPLDFKSLVTEMRYDEVSARYAEFGSFWVGYRIPSHRFAEVVLG